MMLPWFGLGIHEPYHILDHILHKAGEGSFLDAQSIALQHLPDLDLRILALLVSVDDAAFVIAAWMLAEVPRKNPSIRHI